LWWKWAGHKPVTRPCSSLSATHRSSGKTTVRAEPGGDLTVSQHGQSPDRQDCSHSLNTLPSSFPSRQRCEHVTLAQRTEPGEPQTDQFNCFRVLGSPRVESGIVKPLTVCRARSASTTFRNPGWGGEYTSPQDHTAVNLPVTARHHLTRTKPNSTCGAGADKKNGGWRDTGRWSVSPSRFRMELATNTQKRVIVDRKSNKI
jgi:hypothetical protein